ncbi:scavenger receptor cysteine-rich domain-containing protein DMBT1-like isoform X2 [Nelusetta ayraudi]|uniref:scavenger receptor cysteine-rich domain-containing protein DMBT1-like isoform X2 n=1 Tax=Nelusetta ayraudi TaxID=303726 RepID=UPI003F6EFD35
MIDKLHFVCYLSIGLLSLSPLASCGVTRLVGPSRCSGRVEVFHNGKWGTVCDDLWSLTNTDVVCKELDCGAALDAKGGAFFGQGKEDIWLDDVQCTGREQSIHQCVHRSYGSNNCGHGEDIGVICSGRVVVRLADGRDKCSGRVEVRHGDNWYTVCDADWNLAKAQAVCDYLECGSAIDSTNMVVSGQGSGPVVAASGSCFTNGTTLDQCLVTGFLNSSCQHDSDVVVSCAERPTLRLVNGTDRCSGRVEILRNKQWGTVCDDEWDIREAQVVCRAMDCGTATSVKSSAFFGPGEGDISLDDVRCVGNESSLLHCQHRTLGESNCDHSEDAGVVCSSSIRLTNGSTECSGRVEFSHSNQWVAPLNVNWGQNELAVVCREMGCGDPVRSSGVLIPGRKMRGYKVKCSGRESSLTECTVREYVRNNNDATEDVVIECSGNVRLTGGSSRCAGTVEFFNNDQWGTVCSQHWDVNDATVVCKQLNCGKVHKITMNNDFGQATGPIQIDQLECSGQELNLAQCRQRPFTDKTSNTTTIAGVVCTGSMVVWLADGKDKCSGRVQVRHGDDWYTVCDADWNLAKAQAVCDYLECDSAIDLTTTVINKQGSGPVVAASGSCFTNGTTLDQCSVTGFLNSSCQHDSDVVVSCAVPVRLVNGSDQCSGRVEVFYRSQWGTVCDDKWGLIDGNVVCRQLRCGKAVYIPGSAQFGRGSGPIWLDNVECNGEESAISNCTHNPVGENNCGHREDASVICSGSMVVWLADGKDNCSGRVEVRHGDNWYTVCDADWNLVKAQAVCDYLECGSAIDSTNMVVKGQGSGPVVAASGSCFTNGTTLDQCSVTGFLNSSCQHDSDVVVSCAAPVRLVGGSGQCSGRVEVFYRGQWGTVCDDEWGLKDGNVVCRQLGCGKAVSAPGSAYFGRGSGPIWLDNVECSGEESAITHCTHNPVGENNCGHDEDASVFCSGSMVVWLADGRDNCSGRVEVRHGDDWYTVCDADWNLAKAQAVCDYLECESAIDSTNMVVKGQGSGPVVAASGSCFTNGTTLDQCSVTGFLNSSCQHDSDVVVSCAGPVRLVNGSDQCSGRVEVFYRGQWGTVCDDEWGLIDGNVVCRQLGCGEAVSAPGSAYFGRGSGPIWLDNVECSGEESAITHCTHNPVGQSNCGHDEDASVICSGSLAVRLTGGKDECSGRLEVRHGDDWHTVCDRDWNLTKIQAVCDYLECGSAIDSMNTPVNGQGSGPVVAASGSCFTNQTTLDKCSSTGFPTSTCRHDSDVVVSCAAQVRLVGGTGQCSGRVEVFYRGQWGTVCDDEWDLDNGNVVCKQMGCSKALSAPQSAHFGRGTGPIWLDNVDCSGQESAIAHCRHNAVGDNNCGHGEDASVICLGSLEKPQIAISPSLEVHWGDRVEITCTLVSPEHLGGTFFLKKPHSSFKLQKATESETATFVFSAVDFTHRGSYFCEYEKKLPNQVITYPQGSVLELSVDVKLESPMISLSSPYSMVVFSPDEISVDKGSSFSIICSTVSKYPGGYFYLTRSNKNISEAQPAYGHTVFYRSTFEFQQIQFIHQGAYTCVYAVNISSVPYYSVPSKSLQVIVTATSSTSPLSGVLIALLVIILVAVGGYFVWKRRSRVTGAMVQFSNRLGGSIKHDFDDRSNGLFDGRDYGSRTSEPGFRATPDKKADVDTDSTAERNPEDLAGRVCYELEPLVLS